MQASITVPESSFVFTVLKRGLIDVYHHASKKYPPRYVDEPDTAIGRLVHLQDGRRANWRSILRSGMNQISATQA